MIKRFNFLFLLAAFYSSASFAQITLIPFSSGYTKPVDIKNCGDDRFFIVEQRGVIKIADTAGVQFAKPFLDITLRVQNSNEQGLLGLAFPPNFLISGYFYVNYTAKNSGVTHISRFRVDSLTPDSADPASEEIILSIYQPFPNHNGGHLAFGPDGYLYIGMGDGGSGGDPDNRSQNPDSLLGKMLRIDVDPVFSGYSIPPSNPFAKDTSLGRGEIWALGFRNPWRWSFDALTGDLWFGDVGQNVIEEIDRQPAGSRGGLNYGWKCWEGNNQFSNALGCQPFSSYVSPVYQYNQLTGGYCSVTGGYVYRGARYQALYGKYFFADFCLSEIQFLESNNSGGYTHTNLGLLGASNISTFGVDRHGEMYCAGLNSGIIYRLMTSDCIPVATINLGNDTIDDCGLGSVNLSVPAGEGHEYIWTLNEDTVSTLPTFSAIQSGNYVLKVANQSCTNSDSVFVNFTVPLDVTFSGLDTLYCIYHAAVNLVPDYPGGIFTGNGIVGETFNPTIADTGVSIVTYTFTNSTGCTFSHSQSVRVDACLNVLENVWTNLVTVYPNPSPGNFFIQAVIPSEKKIQMEIIDVFGRPLLKKEIILSTGNNSIPVNSAFANGIYFIRFSDEKSSTILKIIVQ